MKLLASGGGTFTILVVVVKGKERIEKSAAGNFL